MITIVCCTNRAGANTRILANIYAGILESLGQEKQIIDLIDLPADFIFSALFEKEGTHPGFNEIQSQVDLSDKFVFIVPEYNGSFPGVLKAFLDGLSYPHSLKGKVGALVGLSTGSMGGALALSHLTDILNYLGMFVLPSKPRLARIGQLIKGEELIDERYKRYLEEQASQLVRMM